jgi:hypothetical protein
MSEIKDKKLAPSIEGDPYDLICPYWANERKQIQFDFEPIKFPKPRLKQQKFLESGDK